MKQEENDQIAIARQKLLAQLIDLRRDAGMTRIYTAFSIPDRSKKDSETNSGSGNDNYNFREHS